MINQYVLRIASAAGLVAAIGMAQPANAAVTIVANAVQQTSDAAKVTQIRFGGGGFRGGGFRGGGFGFRGGGFGFRGGGFRPGGFGFRPGFAGRPGFGFRPGFRPGFGFRRGFIVRRGFGFGPGFAGGLVIGGLAAGAYGYGPYGYGPYYTTSGCGDYGGYNEYDPYRCQYQYNYDGGY